MSWYVFIMGSFFAANWPGGQSQWFGLNYFPDKEPGDHVLCGHTCRIMYGGVRGDPYWDPMWQEAVYWDVNKMPHYVKDLIDTDDNGWIVQDGYHFQLTIVESYEPRYGAMYVQGVCVEWQSWLELYGDDPDNAPWDGPRYQLFEIQSEELVERQADFNGDGVVDTRDVVAFLNQWNLEQ